MVLLLLCSVCFANTPRFDLVFSSDDTDYFYDVNNTWWKTNNKELVTVIRVRYYSQGVTYTEMHGIMDEGNYDCLYWSVIESSEGRNFIDNTKSPQ